MKGKLFLFCGPSGSGKSTLVSYVRGKIKLYFSISATTRKKRSDEIHGQHYFFISKEEFVRKITNNEFLEWEEVYGDKMYGTIKKQVDAMLAEGKNVIFDVDVVGGLKIKNIYGKRALAIYVRPPSVETLRERLQARGTETEASMKERLEKAAHEMSYENKFDKVIINTNLEEAKTGALTLVETFLGKRYSQSPV